VEQLMEAGSDEERELIAEIDICMNKYGCDHITDAHRTAYGQQMLHLPVNNRPTVNMQRVTGRFEKAEQPIAPWGYGDELDETKIPPALRRLLDHVRSHAAFDLGSPRDITLNKRTESFFRLDPHVDPVSDGPNVCIIGLGSPVVLSLSPTRLQLSARRDQMLVAAHSWTNKDVDIKLERGCMVLLCGHARYTWNHGTRLGIGVPAGAKGWLQDWWGRPHELVPRCDGRWSVVFAFGAGGSKDQP
jgi:hypothetical protein